MSKLSGLIALLAVATTALAGFIVKTGGRDATAPRAAIRSIDEFDDMGPKPASGAKPAPTLGPNSPKPALSAAASAGADAVPAPDLLGDAGAPLAAPSLALGDAGVGAGDDAKMPDGAPKSVTFGVVLVTYRGAQGAPGNARSRDEALKLAKELAEVAKSDFKDAVAKGDKGSMEDAGRMPRGALEPPVELALFSLGKGDVSEPIDTPRGFWIAQRIE